MSLDPLHHFRRPFNEEFLDGQQRDYVNRIVCDVCWNTGRSFEKAGADTRRELDCPKCGRTRANANEINLIAEQLARE